MKLQEEIKFIRSDGVIFHLQALPERVLYDMSGWGKPDSEFQTRRGPFQHGDTPISLRLNPRRVSFHIHHKNCNRANWHTYRDTLLNQMGHNNASPNAPVAGTLIWKYPDEDDKPVSRALDCFLEGGLVFEPQGANFNISETLDFVAHNPIVYDPTQQTDTLPWPTNRLVFPTCFPFVTCAYFGSMSITYTGTWETFPTIEIDGPAVDISILNWSTGHEIKLDYSVSLGETVTIELKHDTKSIYNNYGEDLLYTLVDSDLGQFSIMHDPVVEDGINYINVAMGNFAAGRSEVRIKYYNRYYGV